SRSAASCRFARSLAAFAATLLACASAAASLATTAAFAASTSVLYARDTFNSYGVCHDSRNTRAGSASTSSCASRPSACTLPAARTSIGHCPPRPHALVHWVPNSSPPNDFWSWRRSLATGSR
ncbi:unnamed protein product, partial [Ectocarpus sp. 12 AP-2014]